MHLQDGWGGGRGAGALQRRRDSRGCGIGASHHPCRAQEEPSHPTLHTRDPKLSRWAGNGLKGTGTALEEPHGDVFALLSVFNLIPELPQIYIHIVRIGRSCCQNCC